MIILADDDADDRLLLQEAFDENKLPCQLSFVEDGVELIKYLDKAENLPFLILLDINMPRKDGKQILSELRTNDKWKHLPVVMFTTSKSPQDIKTCYELGANSYIIKPTSFEKLVEVVNAVGHYWIDTVALVKDI